MRSRYFVYFNCIISDSKSPPAKAVVCWLWLHSINPNRKKNRTRSHLPAVYKKRYIYIHTPNETNDRHLHLSKWHLAKLLSVLLTKHSKVKRFFFCWNSQCISIRNELCSQHISSLQFNGSLIALSVIHCEFKNERENVSLCLLYTLLDTWKRI